MNTEALSAADAIAALSGVSDEAPEAEEIVEDEDNEQEDDEIDAEADVQADADEEGDDPEEDPDADEEEDDDEPAEPAIEAPQFLDEKMRADWSKLPREAQEMVLAHDKSLVADYTRKTQEVAAERKQVQAQRSQLDQIVSRYDEVLPEAEQKAREWQELNWVDLKANTTADQYLAYQAQAQQDIQKAVQIRNQRSQAEVESLNVHVQTEHAKLQEIARAQNAVELIQPEKAQAVTTELLNYVRSHGYQDDEIKYIGAQDMVMAYKAMKYDQMLANRKNPKPALTPKPDARTNAKPVRAGARASSSKRAASKDVAKSFQRTGDRNLAMELLKDID